MITGYYVPVLVVVSILVAMLASYAALGLTMRVRRAAQYGVDVWTIGGALAMGTGIWAMHFIGMLAYRLPIPIAYDPWITFISWLLPVISCGLALWRLQQPAFTRGELAFSALMMGLGISTMHYSGMAGMRLDPVLSYDAGLQLLSIAIAVMASALALAVGVLLRTKPTRRGLLHLGAALILGIAIAGMHYTGMAAAQFAPDSVCMVADGGVNQDHLAVLVTIGSVALLSIAVLATIFDARLESRNRTIERSLEEAAERQQLYLDEQRARVEAEHVSLMKDEFLATLSHELRTPLNAMLGWTQLLMQGERDGATVRRGLETIERNARAQSQLIEDLLDMSRLLAGKVRIEPRIIAPQEFVTVAIETARPAALAKHIVLDAHIEQGIGSVLGDASRMQQVLSNLLSNAIKFSEPGGLVHVALEQEGEHLRLTVTDHGAGISPDFLPHVFDRFRQADASSARRHGGLGLGLAIARQLVELQGGTIQVHSDGAGTGATFHVRLPRANVANVATLLPEEGGKMPVLDLQGVTVLVIDDTDDSLDLVQRVLAGCGADVVTAGNVEEALTALESNVPHLLISDICMPRVDGFELMRRVRASHNPELAGIAAIALTAFSRKEDRVRALQAGYDEFLVKPVRPTTLLQAAVSIVTRRSMLRSA